MRLRHLSLITLATGLALTGCSSGGDDALEDSCEQLQGLPEPADEGFIEQAEEIKNNASDEQLRHGIDQVISMAEILEDHRTGDTSDTDAYAEVVELADDDAFVEGMTYLQEHCEVQF
ncbi:hypothetical protein [Auritidibacter ignavus]|uniref:hypothetical protein n=1 Tax=Auritidibacter ignavus TaxID=678932 RepID=UPI00109C9742|nr:hypothetical protein [Auritidibacter ignavus]